jgi:hypothetical protein
MSITQNFTTTQSLPFVAWLETQVTPAEFATLRQSFDQSEALTQGAIDRGDLNITADAQGATQQWSSQEALDQFQAQRAVIPGIQQLNQYLAQYWS